MKTRIFNLLVFSLLVLSTGAMAQRPGNRETQNNDHSGRRELLLHRMESQKEKWQDFFSDEQLEAVKSIRLNTARQLKPLNNELRELMAHQQTLTTSDNADLKAIHKNIDKMAEVHAEIAKIRAKQQQDIRSLLTEEQRLKFDAMNNHRNREIRFPEGRMKRVPGGFDKGA